MSFELAGPYVCYLLRLLALTIDIRFAKIDFGPGRGPGTRQLHHVGGDVYISFNTLAAPKPRRHKSSLDTFYPEDCYTRAAWFSSRYPFLGFSCVTQFWEGPIFGRLAGSLSTLPVKNIQESQWHLDPDLQRRWIRLETALILVYETTLSQRPDLPHPLEMEKFRLPSQWGYMRFHESERAARIRILNSRNAFVPLLALCMYAVALAYGRDLEHGEQRTARNWMQTLIEQQGVDPEWVNSLIESDFFSTRTARVGVYFNFPAHPWPHIIEAYVCFGAPVWVLLPPDNFDRLPNIIRPTVADVPVIQEQHKQHPDTSARKQQQPTHLPQSSNEPPSRQRIGESVHEFIRRTKAHNARQALQEAIIEQSKRLDREREAATHRCPGLRGAHVFEWINSNGVAQRKYVQRSQVPIVWYTYADSQRWYNGFRNEWELCSSLDPSATPDDNCDYDSDEHFNRAFDKQFEAQTATGDLPVISREEVEEAYPEQAPSTSDVPFESFESNLFLRYGFHYDNQVYAAPPTLIREDFVSRTLVEKEFNVPNARIKDAVHHYVSYLVSDDRHISIPAPLYDMHEMHSTPLRAGHNQAFAVQVVSANAHYTLKARDGTPGIIHLPYASSVTEALRLSNCTTIAELALHFVSRGSSFHVGAVEEGANPFEIPSGAPSGLGFRPSNFVATSVDYQSYIERRKELLSDPVIVRAALMKGGIIWRLTIDSIRDLEGGVDFTRYLDDDLENVQLTQRELGIIVGLYLVWTGK